MRKILAVALWLSFACVAQTQTHTFCPTDAACTWTGAQTLNIPILGNYTVATLPTPHTYQQAFVSDGSTANDCTVGGGSSKVLCYYNGSAWTASSNGGAPSGSAGGSLTGTFPNPTLAPGVSNTWTASQTAPFLDKGGAVYNVAAYGNSIQTAINAAGPGGHVYVPVGTYNIATSLKPLSGQVIECAGGNLLAQSGAIIKPTGAIWAMENPNADITSGSHGVNSVVISGCTFDLTGDPTHVLGSIRMKGIGWSKFYNINIATLNNTNPALTLDGLNDAYNSGDYNNEFYSLSIYDVGTPGTSHTIGIYNTGDSNNGSNDNHFFGGAVNNVGTAIKVDQGSDNNAFYSMDLEGWNDYCIYVGGNANSNLFMKDRCEVGSSNVGTSIYAENGTKGNDFYRIFQAGGNSAGSFGVDLSGGLNNWDETIYGSRSSAYFITNHTANFANLRYGVNMLPVFADGSTSGGLTVTGEIQASNALVVQSAGGGASIMRPASSISGNQTLSIPDISPNSFGAFALNDSVNGFSATQYLAPTGTAISGTNYGSNLLNFLGSYWNGTAAAQDTWELHSQMLTGTNPGTILSLFHTGSPGTASFAVTSQILINQVTAATNANNYASPALQWWSNYWNGSASTTDIWSVVPVVGSGTNPTSTLSMTHSGSSGVSAFAFPLTSTNIMVGNGSNVATGVAVSGDCALANTGALTCTKTNNVSFATSATTDTTNATNITTGTLPLAQAPTGMCYSIKSSDTIPFALTGTTAETEVAKYILPALTANATVHIVNGALFGNTGNTGTLTIRSYLGTTSMNSVASISRANAWYASDFGFSNIGSASVQVGTLRYGNSNSTLTEGAFNFAIDTSTAKNFIIKFTPTVSADTWTWYAPTVIVCNGL